MQVLEVGVAARTARPFAFFQMRRRFDLDDVGAPVGELAHASRAGPDAGEIEDGKAGQGLGGPWKWHFDAPNGLIRSGNGFSRPTFPDLPRLVHRAPAHALCSSFGATSIAGALKRPSRTVICTATDERPDLGFAGCVHETQSNEFRPASSVS